VSNVTPINPVDLDLDAERPTTFRLRGVVFTLRSLSYRAFAAADEKFMAKLNALNETDAAEEAEYEQAVKDAETAGMEPPPRPDVAENNSRWAEQLDAFAEFAEANIVEGDIPRFRELREREQDGIQQRDVRTLRRWLWEAQVGRPLESAEGSSPGPGSNEASSTAGSGSPAVGRPSSA
jgi:hypothetical protein